MTDRTSILKIIDDWRWMGKGGQEEEEEKEKEEKEEVMLLKGIHLLLQWEIQLHTWQ